MKPAQEDHDYADVRTVPNILVLCEYKEAAITYITGYVTTMVRKKTHCNICNVALLSGSDRGSHLCFIIERKDRGGLHRASKSVVRICEETEKCFQVLLKPDHIFSKHCPMPFVICTTVLYNISNHSARHTIFSCIDNPMFDTAVEDNHVHKLISWFHIATVPLD